MINRNGFTLIEIIIATFIVGVGILGIYKLINSNMLLISKSNDSLAIHTLENPFKECIKSKGFSAFSSYSTLDKFSINFGNDLLGCNISTYSDDFSFTSVNLDNVEYYLYGEVKTKTASKILLELDILNNRGDYLFGSGSASMNKYFILKN